VIDCFASLLNRVITPSILNSHDFYSSYDSDDWKAFISRPALPFCLKMLTGLCKKHKLTQELVGNTAIDGLHKLEQVII